jgi:hypothetical protein
VDPGRRSVRLIRAEAVAPALAPVHRNIRIFPAAYARAWRSAGPSPRRASHATPDCDAAKA